MSQDQVESAQIVALESALRLREDKTPANADPAELPPEHDLPPERDLAPEHDLAPKPDLPQDAEPHEAVETPVPDAPVPDAPAPQYTAPPEAEVPEAKVPVMDAPQEAPADLDLVGRMRALPPGSLSHDLQARALHDRLAALAARLAAPPRHTQI